MNTQIHIDFISSIILFGIIQAIVILAIFIRKRPLGYLFIVVLIASFMFQEIEAFLITSGFMIYILPLFNVSVPFAFLLGPSLKFYSTQLLGNKVHWKAILFHYMPFILYFFYSFFYFLQPLERKYYAYMKIVDPQLSISIPTQKFGADPLDIQGIVVVELIGLHLLMYGILNLHKIYTSRKTINKEGIFLWLISLNALLFFGGLILLLSEGGIVNGKILYEPILPSFMARVYGTFSLYIISTYLMTNSNFFKYGRGKYEKSSLTKEIRILKLQKIVNILEQEKPFLDDSYSLTELAKKSNMIPNHVTEVINKELKMTFFDLTNQYRIKEAKKLLTKRENHLKMEQLAYSLGYKSKSAFFNAFKKQTMLTPSQYKNSKLSTD